MATQQVPEDIKTQWLCHLKTEKMEVPFQYHSEKNKYQIEPFLSHFKIAVISYKFWNGMLILKAFQRKISWIYHSMATDALSAIFFAKKWRTKPQGFTSLSRQAQLHIFTRRQPLFTELQKPCLWSRSLRSLVKTFRLRSTCEVFSLREYGWCSLYFALRLHGGFATLIFLFVMLYYFHNKGV